MDIKLDIPMHIIGFYCQYEFKQAKQKLKTY